MKPVFKYFGWALILLSVLLVPACSKVSFADYQYNDAGRQGYAIGTVRSRDGVRFIRLDELTCSLVANPEEVQNHPDGTRLYLEYRYVLVGNIPDFCTDAILVEWASPLPVGEIRYDLMAKACDPVEIVPDWMTSLEDGFLTLHYKMQASGKVQHTFSLYPTADPTHWRLIHDACGDTDGELVEGLVCFNVEGIEAQFSMENAVSSPGEGPVILSLEYTDLQNMSKSLTVEYRAPK